MKPVQRPDLARSGDPRNSYRKTACGQGPLFPAEGFGAQFVECGRGVGDWAGDATPGWTGKRKRGATRVSPSTTKPS